MSSDIRSGTLWNSTSFKFSKRDTIISAGLGPIGGKKYKAFLFPDAGIYSDV